MKVKYKTPGQLTIAEFKQFQDIYNSNISDIEKNIKALPLLTNLTKEQVYKLSTIEGSDIIQTMITTVNNYNNTKHNYTTPKKIVINGTKYVVNYDLEKFTVAQYIDFQTTYNNFENVDNLHKLLSIFIIPKGKKYNEDYDIKELQELLYENLTIDIAFGISFFLQKRFMSSIKAKLRYYRWKAKTMKWITRNKETKQVLNNYIETIKNLENSLM